MGDMGDVFSTMKGMGQEKRHNNLVSSIKILKDNDIEFSLLSPVHVRIGVYDFWPSTGLFINRDTKKRDRGVFRLLKLMGVKVKK